MFLTRREPGVPLSLFRPYPLPFSPAFFFYCSLPFLFFYVFFHWSISAVVSGEAFYSICCFPCCSQMFLTRREPGVPVSLFRPYPLPFSPPFLLLFIFLPFLLSFSLIYICCSFRGGILSVVFPAVSICVWPAGNLECPCLFSDLILFPFLLRFSFSSILILTLPFLLCLFHWSICAVVSGEALYLLFSPL